jgi:hypothetical protein
MRRLLSAFVVVLGSATACLAQAPTNDSPEGKVLDQWAGDWNVEVESDPGEWVPQPGKFEETKGAKWILDGRFLEESIKNPRGEARTVFGYDPQRSAYRLWYFNSDGVLGEWTGEWDEKSKTMNWTSDMGDGIDAKASTRFNDRDNYDFEITIKGANETVLMHLKAKHTRAKK